ncbi:MAG: type VI secretion system tip protein TssI/VgrG [Polyangiaceae bacterium]
MAAPAWNFVLTVAGVDTTSWRVFELEAREAVSEGCRAWLEVGAAGQVDPQSVVYKEATLEISRLGDDPRYFHGVVVSAAALAAPRGTTHLRIEIGAHIELLRVGRNSLIFQNKSIQDVVKAIANAGPLQGDKTQWLTTTAYEPHSHLIQHNESDYDFVSRLLFEEGIWFAVHNDGTKDQVVFFDDPSQPPPIPGDATLSFQLDRSKTSAHGWIVELSDRHSAASDAVMTREYDLQHPSRGDLDAKKAAPKGTGREVYQHPGNWLVADGTTSDKIDAKVGARKAQRILERLQLGTRTFRGRGTCLRLEPGATFTLVGHPRTSMNMDHLVLDVVHRGWMSDAEEPFYENEFVTAPKSVPYRPQVAPEAPVIGGIQWAIATVPPGGEIHADNYGRVKCRFLWDRSGITDDKSSTWMRVGQLPLGGSMILPRNNFEVTVDFTLGDVDRPFVTGHLYNGLQKPPYALPAGATRSSIQSATTSGGAGANELRFEDSAGAEEIFLNASKDYTLSVDNDSSVHVKANETFKVGSNNQLSVGADHGMSVQGSRTLSVGASQEINVAGDLSDGVGGAETLAIGGTRHVKCGGDLDESVAGTLSRTVGSLQSVIGIAGYMRAVKGDSTTKVGAAWAEVAGSDRSSVCSGARKETIGALKFVKAKAMSISAGAAYTANVGGYKVTCGGGRTDSATGAVSVAAGGGWSIKATNVSFVADNKLVLIAGGTTVTLSSSGEIKIKAAGSIKLTGVEKLKQGKHDSGG